MPVDEFDIASWRTQRQAAEFLGVSERTLRRMIHDRELESVKVRGRVMVTQRALLDYVNRHVNRVSHDANGAEA